jgi:hypothetical protein
MSGVGGRIPWEAAPIVAAVRAAIPDPPSRGVPGQVPAPVSVGPLTSSLDSSAIGPDATHSDATRSDGTGLGRVPVVDVGVGLRPGMPPRGN